MKVRDIEKILADTGENGFDPHDGLLYGDPNMELAAVQVCWMATVEAIEHAVAVGANLIVSHEALFYPYPGIRGDVRPDGYLDWEPNRRRRELLERHKLAVIRLHGPMDRLCIIDVFVDLLNLQPTGRDGDDFYRVYTIDPLPIRKLADHIKQQTGMRILRATPCDPEKKIQRVGIAFGGAALFVNADFMQNLLALQPDLIIAGETDCYGFVFPTDAGVPMIETSHEISENAGVRVFADRYLSNLPVPTHYFENPRCWMIM